MANFEDFVKQYPALFKDSIIPESWKPLLESVITAQTDCVRTIALVLSCLRETDWFPHSDKLWSFTKFCRPEDVKVVIVGKEPSNSHATGLAFSIDIGSGIYPSTTNILEEVRRDIGDNNLRPFPTDYGNLDHWAKQGVLLLNSALTKSTYRMHQDIGWDIMLGELIKQLQQINKNIVFMFWGWDAKFLSSYVEDYDGNKLDAGHPSPNNTKENFVGCKHFSTANGWLVKHDIEPIDWCPVPPTNIS
uniref:Uncharacterized protein LOC114330696 n=1 Tax=Diabrotica virgifera virgifera TaxID=50390 RepID=A0A6P7FLV8_DIAVI